MIKGFFKLYRQKEAGRLHQHGITHENVQHDALIKVRLFTLRVHYFEGCLYSEKKAHSFARHVTFSAVTPNMFIAERNAV